MDTRLMGIVDLNKLKYDDVPSGGQIVDLSQIKFDAQPTIPQAVSEGLTQDPMAAQVGMVQQGPGLQEAGKLATEYAPEIGLIGGGLLGSGPMSPATAGMGYAAGKMVKSAFEGQEPPTPMQDITNLGEGAAYELGGKYVGKLAERFLAPAGGKIDEGLRKGIEYLQSKKLPFSADLAGTGRISQKVSDWMGFGRLYTNHQRTKLAEGLTDTVSDISKEIGIPVNMTPSETGTAVADFLQAVTQKGPYYENFNNIVKGIPETKWPNTLDAIQALGKRVEGTASDGMELAYKEGIKNIKNVYTGKRGKALVGELESLIQKDGVMNGEEASALINQLWTSVKYKDLSGTGQNLIGRLKEGFMSDMESFAVPGTADTLATVRAAADKATHEALKWIENSSVTGKFLRVQLQGPRKVFTPKWEGHIEEGLPTMITNVTKNDVIGLRDRMIEAGKPELWEATQLAYLQKVFDKTVKDGVFDPKKYLTWYDQYGKVASEVMPELSGNLAQWANVSKATGKDFVRMKAGQLAGGLGVGVALGGLEAVRSGDYTKLISVPVAFSTIAALGTMGPGRLGFLRNWALKETSPIAAPVAELATKIGAAQLFGGDQNVPVFPGSNLSFGPGMGTR